MARRVVHGADGSKETWDDELDTYVRLDSSGHQVTKRVLSSLERSMLDPNRAKIRELNEAVDQLILDSLMGGMF